MQGLTPLSDFSKFLWGDLRGPNSNRKSMLKSFSCLHQVGWASEITEYFDLCQLKPFRPFRPFRSYVRITRTVPGLFLRPWVSFEASLPPLRLVTIYSIQVQAQPQASRPGTLRGLTNKFEHHVLLPPMGFSDGFMNGIMNGFLIHLL